MTKPLALVLKGDGINCDNETVSGLKLAGFDVRSQHVSSFIEDQGDLTQAKLLAIPGGFSFGDEIASGKVLALKLRERVMDSLHGFIDRNGLVIGICNGFQVLTQLGILPRSGSGARRIVTLTKNNHGHFNDRWVDLTVRDSLRKTGNATESTTESTTKSTTSAAHTYFSGLTNIELPVRHGEGRLVVADSEYALEVQGSAPLRYADDINGSFDRIAALTNASGTVLGLMPHPEAFVRWTQHPMWTTIKITRPELARAVHPLDLPASDRPHGFTILRNAFEMVN